MIIRTLTNVFKVPELRNKVLFTLGMLAVFRVGHWIPLPGINQEQIKEHFDSSRTQGSAFGQLADRTATRCPGSGTAPASRSASTP
jgi:preprotein translocase subunit SecY